MVCKLTLIQLAPFPHLLHLQIEIYPLKTYLHPCSSPFENKKLQRETSSKSGWTWLLVISSTPLRSQLTHKCWFSIKKVTVKRSCLFMEQETKRWIRLLQHDSDYDDWMNWLDHVPLLPIIVGKTACFHKSSKINLPHNSMATSPITPSPHQCKNFKLQWFHHLSIV